MPHDSMPEIAKELRPDTIRDLCRLLCRTDCKSFQETGGASCGFNCDPDDLAIYENQAEALVDAGAVPSGWRLRD